MFNLEYFIDFLPIFKKNLLGIGTYYSQIGVDNGTWNLFFKLKRLIGSAFPKREEGKLIKTKISPLLKPLNKDVGLAVLGWGTTPLMVVILILFLIFLIVLVTIYNSSLVLQGVNVDWEDFY